jgi:AcrR family transcriptional regulator
MLDDDLDNVKMKKRSIAAPHPPAVKGVAAPEGTPRYHHGALQDALIAATEAILAERGVEGFSLREAARRAGVSPAAPAHHFDSAAALLTEVAIRGYEELARALSAADASNANDAAARVHAQGIAYVNFALAFPGRFQLMFRHGWLKSEDERLRAAIDAAHAELERATRAYLGLGAADSQSRKVAVTMIGAWSAVHGFAHLALDGKFRRIAGATPLPVFVSEILPEVLANLFPPRKRSPRRSRS